MKITENILTQPTDTDSSLESLYQAIAEVDADFPQEMENYHKAMHALLEEVPICRPSGRS